MEIRRAGLADLETAMALYDLGRQFMRRSGNLNQWVNGYPGRDVVAEDISLGRTYLMMSGEEAAAVFCFFAGADVEPSYRVIDGAWLDDGPYGVLHRVASNGRVGGVMERCTAWGLERCPSLRVDTHRDNLPMQRALKRCGYRYCGVVTIADGTERLAYQRLR